MNHVIRFLFWPTFFFTHLIAVALLAWHLLAQFHFAYPLGYQLLGLESHIAEYAPLNRYKADFEYSSQEEHWRLFGEISNAVQNNGEGLGNIQYTLRNGQPTAFMHEAEIIHLQDVANLINVFYLAGISCAFIWLCLLGTAWSFKLTPPSLKKVFLGFVGLLVSITIVVLLVGAKKVFYWLHVQIFPDNHQWFFYYQDSLMTTLMKAPDIFAFITILLLGMLIVFWSGSYWAMTQFCFGKKNTSTKKGAGKKKKTW